MTMYKPKEMAEKVGVAVRQSENQTSAYLRQIQPYHLWLKE